MARRTGVSRRLLRYYEEQSLLRPTRLANGYREYSDSDVVAVRNIRAMLAAGLSTVAIARLIDCFHDDDQEIVPASCPELINSLNRERARVAEAISDLRASQQALDALFAAAMRVSTDPETTAEMGSTSHLIHPGGSPDFLEENGAIS